MPAEAGNITKLNGQQRGIFIDRPSDRSKTRAAPSRLRDSRCIAYSVCLSVTAQCAVRHGTEPVRGLERSKGLGVWLFCSSLCLQPGSTSRMVWPPVIISGWRSLFFHKLQQKDGIVIYNFGATTLPNT